MLRVSRFATVEAISNSEEAFKPNLTFFERKPDRNECRSQKANTVSLRHCSSSWVQIYLHKHFNAEDPMDDSAETHSEFTVDLQVDFKNWFQQIYLLNG